MRISDWSSDVCSSDLGLTVTIMIAQDPPYGGTRTKQRFQLVLERPFEIHIAQENHMVRAPFLPFREQRPEAPVRIPIERDGHLAFRLRCLRHQGCLNMARRLVHVTLVDFLREPRCLCESRHWPSLPAPAVEIHSMSFASRPEGRSFRGRYW